MYSEWIDLFSGSNVEPSDIEMLANLLPGIMAVDWRGEECLTKLQRVRVDCFAYLNTQLDDPRKSRLRSSVLCDLRGQGWAFTYDDGRILGRKPDLDSGTPQEIKARIRTGLELERNVQLQKSSVRSFIDQMEGRRLGPNGWTSIFSLMRDGSELAQQLKEAAAMPSGGSRERALRQIVDPYIQVVDDTNCKYTWLELKEIWRYFRHTWSIPHQTVPGRNIWFLVRDRAAPNHPIIGIAALGSAIVQLKERDLWIGWHREALLSRLTASPTDAWARWVADNLDEAIHEIYVADFLQEQILLPEDLRRPSQESIERLLILSSRARETHRLYPAPATHKADTDDTDWKKRAETHLYRSKRANTLAKLLEAKRRLIDMGFDEPTKESLERALSTPEGQRAVAVILRRVKATRVGIHMMDIIVCGAVPPYNAILGGKLVSLLMSSPEVVAAYRQRYEDQPSIIASSMAGRKIVRNQQLVLLGTTSLYGVGSSQYNRIRMSAEEVGGTENGRIEYHFLSHTTGYGSFHFSADTTDEISRLLAQSRHSRRVNSIFGEGVNPRLRKMRDALDMVGLDSDAVLQHGNRRIIYGVPLASNFREVLLGIDEEPDWLLPTDNPAATTSAIADFWIRRWLSGRITRDGVLDRVAKHRLTYPIRHGARVQLPPVDEIGPLFAD